MKMLYDKQVDALYIEFRQIDNGSASVKDISESIAINYDSDGKIAGIEILEASKIMYKLEESKKIEQFYKNTEVIYA